ncbi:hypothetical protein GJ496_000079 [Pomphorhynchus laevis]|nr:hypothetical protein GJ496_000079 [Pomphorhynchus laevis]
MFCMFFKSNKLLTLLKRLQMPGYAQLIMGPAGSGKSTYCSNMVKHMEVLRRNAYVINLDPAAEECNYPLLADIKDLISLQDVMEDDEMNLGPNGGLVFCLDDLLQSEDDVYIIIDLPGQIELYTHMKFAQKLTDMLRSLDFKICALFLLDAQFIIDPPKFIAGMLVALSVLVNVEVPHISIMSKMDLLNSEQKQIVESYLEPDLFTLQDQAEQCGSALNERYQNLNKNLVQVLNDYSLVRFIPLDPNDEDSFNHLLSCIDMATQFYDDREYRENPDIPFD